MSSAPTFPIQQNYDLTHCFKHYKDNNDERKISKVLQSKDIVDLVNTLVEKGVMTREEALTSIPDPGILKIYSNCNSGQEKVQVDY